MDRQESHDPNLSAILPHVRQTAVKQAEVHLQRHVEALPQSDRQVVCDIKVVNSDIKVVKRDTKVVNGNTLLPDDAFELPWSGSNRD